MIRFLQRHRGTQGSVTILMLIIMLPMLVFSFTIVDLCKIYMAKNVVSDAANLALNAGMTQYDKILNDTYGILASSQSEEELAEKMSAYYAATLAANGISDDDLDMEHLLTQLLGKIDGIDTDVFEEDNSLLNITPVIADGSSHYLTYYAYESSAASNPAVMERQIVEYMKYRGPVNMSMGMFDKLNALKDLPNQADVTTTRMEFENQLNDINNDAIDIYTKIKCFFYNNEIAEHRSITSSIVYENEKKKLVEKYKYTGNYYNANDIDYNLTALQTELKCVSLLVMVYAPFYDYFKTSSELNMISLGSVSGSAETIADGLTDAEAVLKGTTLPHGTTDDIDFSEMCNLIESGERIVNDFCQFDNHYWNSRKYDKNGIDEVHNLIWTIRAFSKLYRSGKGEENEVANNSKTFLEYYKAAKSRVKTAKTPEEISVLQNAIDSAEDTYEIFEKYEDLVEWMSETANKKFNETYVKMKELYSFAEKQWTIISELSENNGELDKLAASFSDAKTYAEETYEPAVNKVQSDNQRNSAQQTYNNEAEMISEIDAEAVAKLKAALQKHKNDYYYIMYALKNLKVFTEYPDGASPEKVVNENKFTLRHDKIEQYCNGDIMNVAPTNEAGWSFVWDKVYSAVEYDKTSEGFHVKDWVADCNTEDIKENALYKQIVKLSEPSDKVSDADKKAAKENESTIKNNNSTSGTDSDGNPSLPGDVEATQDTAAEETSTEDDKKAFSDMCAATKFSDFIKTSDEATKVIKQEQTLDDSQMKVDAGLDTTGSNSDISKNAVSMIQSVSTMMSVIGELLEEGRDALFVTEYLTGNFSCHTTSMDGKGKRTNDAKMLSGELFYMKTADKVKKNVGYTYELEYILYGLDSELANKAAAGGTIFAVRFVLNLIYSFTDTEIRNTTYAIATCVSGWLPFAVPLVQTVLHIAISLAESAIDLTYLMQGAAVPLYKTTTTWYCKGSNILRKVAAEVISQASGVVVDLAADKLCELIEAGEEKGNEFVEAKQEYIDAQIESLRDQVKNQVISPISETLQQCMTNISDIQSGANGKEEIKKQLTKSFDTLLENLKAQSDDENYVNAITIQIVTALKGNADSISDEIYSNLDSFVSAATTQLSADTTIAPLTAVMEEKLKTVYDTVERYIGKAGDSVDELSEKAKEFVGKISDNVTEAIESVSKELQGGVEKTADEIKEMINTKVSSMVTGHKNVDFMSSTGKVTTAAEHALDMTYQDYLYIFTAIGSIANRDKMLERAALLMQANCVVRGEESGYTLNEAKTFFYVDVAASVPTTFYGAVFKDGQLDMSAARKEYEFTMESYMGY